MSLGHGQLGAVSGIRPIEDLLEDQATDRLFVLELRPAKIVPAWYVHSGATYVAPFDVVFDGVTLDVVGVRSLLDTGLARAETLAACVATAGSYYYDPDVPTAAYRWDDGVTHWDQAGVKWDQLPLLYVHLADGSSPNNTSVIAVMQWWVADRDVVVPNLGTQKLVNGDFETWTDPTTPGTWVKATSHASFSVDREAVSVASGTYAAKLSFSAPPGAGFVSIEDSPICVVGAQYRLSGYYETGAGDDASAVVRIYINDGAAQSLSSDGRSYGAGQSIVLTPTRGERRRFFVDFRAFVGAIKVKLDLDGAAGSGQVIFDQVALQRIWRWALAEGRVSAQDLPASRVGANDIFFGGQMVGSGAASIVGADGLVDTLFGPSFEWAGQEVRAHAGGKFRDGTEIPFEHWKRTFTGLVQHVEWSETHVRVDMNDVRSVVHRQIPTRAYNAFELPAMNSQLDSKPRPLLIGTKTGIAPGRRDKDATTGYGVYELCDTTDAPNGIKTVDAVYAYLTEEAASARDPALRILLAAGTDYSTDLALARVTTLQDVRVIEISAEAAKLDFDIGGSALVATLTAGLYTPASLAVEVAARMTAAAAATIACAYSDPTHKVTISKGSGTLNLRTSTGANGQITAYDTLGYDQGADRTGALSYDAETAIFTDVDREHILRVDAKGYKDDASGTYTGTPSALIEKGPDVVRLLWRRFLGLDLSLVDAVSFSAARTSAPAPLGIYLAAPTSTKDVFDRIQTSTLSQIVIDGLGCVYYYPYNNEGRANGITLSEADFVQPPAMGRGVADIYATIQVLYDADPVGSKPKIRTADKAAVRLSKGRPDLRPFDTYLVQGNDAQVLANDLLILSISEPRTVNGLVGSVLLGKTVTDKVQLSLTRALGGPGEAWFRIAALEHFYSDGTTRARLVEDTTL